MRTKILPYHEIADELAKKTGGMVVKWTPGEQVFVGKTEYVRGNGGNLIRVTEKHG